MYSYEDYIDENATPGSDIAIKLGCTCPPMDNNHGKGFKIEGKTCFYYQCGCPIHDKDNSLLKTEE